LSLRVVGSGPIAKENALRCSLAVAAAVAQPLKIQIA
jgi:hypothetical protein